MADGEETTVREGTDNPCPEMTRDLCVGTLTYRLLADKQDGMTVYGIGSEENTERCRITAEARGITPSRRAALALARYLFLSGVSACQMCDVIEDLLPVEGQSTLALIGEDTGNTPVGGIDS